MSDTIQPADLKAPLGEDGIPVVDGSSAIARRLVAQFGTDAAEVAQRWAETTDRRYFAVADLIRFGTARDAARGDTMTDPQPTPINLDHAREAIRLVEKWRHMASTLPGLEWGSLGDLRLHAYEHYGDIAAALIAAHEALKATDGAVAFVVAIFGGDYERGDWDGGDLQGLGVTTGVLVKVTVTEQCVPDGGCICEEYGFPTTCYRLNPALREATPGGHAMSDHATRTLTERVEALEETQARKFGEIASAIRLLARQVNRLSVDVTVSANMQYIVQRLDAW